MPGMPGSAPGASGFGIWPPPYGGSWSPIAIRKGCGIWRFCEPAGFRPTRQMTRSVRCITLLCAAGAVYTKAFGMSEDSRTVAWSRRAVDADGQQVLLLQEPKEEV